MDAQVQAALDDLNNKVAAEKTVEDSAITLLGQIKAALDAALANSNPADVVAAVQAISSHIGSNTDALAAAVTANTPTPPAPTGSTGATGASGAT